MRTLIRVTAATLITLIGVSSSAQQPGGKLNYSPKSENAALAWSSSAFLVPVAAGAATWLMQDARRFQHYDSWGLGYSYYEEPDRTAASLMIVSGVVIGPSIGYFYAGCPKQGLISIAKRVGIIGGSLLVGGLAFNEPFGENSMTETALITGGVLTIISAIHDVAAVKGTVREHNAAQGKLTVTPVYFPDSDAAGLGLSVRF